MSATGTRSLKPEEVRDLEHLAGTRYRALSRGSGWDPSDRQQTEILLRRHAEFLARGGDLRDWPPFRGLLDGDEPQSALAWNALLDAATAVAATPASPDPQWPRVAGRLESLIRQAERYGMSLANDRDRHGDERRILARRVRDFVERVRRLKATPRPRTKADPGELDAQFERLTMDLGAPLLRRGAASGDAQPPAAVPARPAPLPEWRVPPGPLPRLVDNAITTRGPTSLAEQLRLAADSAKRFVEYVAAACDPNAEGDYELSVGGGGKGYGIEHVWSQMCLLAGAAMAALLPRLSPEEEAALRRDSLVTKAYAENEPGSAVEVTALLRQVLFAWPINAGEPLPRRRVPGPVVDKVARLARCLDLFRQDYGDKSGRTQDRDGKGEARKPLTGRQTEVWKALDGAALSAQELAQTIYQSAQQEGVVRNLIKAMRSAGWDIKHRAGRGYFRPDSPPKE